MQGVGVLGEDAFLPDVAVVSALGRWNEPLGRLVHGELRHQRRAPPDVAHALAQEGADGAALGRIEVGRRDEVGPQQVGQLFRIDAVVLVLPAVDVLEVEGMREHEGDLRLKAGIGQPVPVEGALAHHGQVVAVGFDPLEEIGEVVAQDVAVDQLLALPVHDADVHLPRVQIDSAIVFGRGRVILHQASPHECFEPLGHRTRGEPASSLHLGEKPALPQRA